MCVETLGCGDTWCDPDTNLCWMTRPAPDKMFHDDAEEYCETLDLAGKSGWRLPDANELAGVARGCDGRDGTLEDLSYRSTCRLSSTLTDYMSCSTCPTSAGPSGSCYWVQEFGSCTSSEVGHWSSTGSPSFPGTSYYFNFQRSNFSFNVPDFDELSVRCVTTR